MQPNAEQQIEQMIESLKKGSDVSAWKKNRNTAPTLNLISRINDLPKTSVPSGDLMRVKAQILDRISLPQTESGTGWVGSLASWTHLFRTGAVALGSFLIMLLAAGGTVVVAQNALPGDTFYPVKKFVENMELRLASDAKRAELQIKFADNRMDELESILAQKQAGALSEDETEKIVTRALKDLEKTATEAAKVAASQPTVATKLADLTTKLQSASIQSEGQVKAEIEKTAASTRISQEQAIENIQRAGLKVETSPIVLEDAVKASGKLTVVAKDSVSIGTAKFLITKDTRYVNITADKLAVDQKVDIQAKIKDNKTYAEKIILVASPEPDPAPESPDTSETDSADDAQ